MPTFAVYTNGTFQGYVSAVSLRQAKARAKRLHPRQPLDVIGIMCKAERSGVAA